MRIRRTLVAAVLSGALAVSGGLIGSAPASAAVHHPEAAAPRPATIPLPTNARVYFFGDSWTHGASADEGRGFPVVAGQALGWTVEIGPDESGAGYVHTFDTDHALFPEAAAALPRIDADLVVLEGGLNDGPGPLTHLWDRVALTVRTLRAKTGGAPVVLVGPVFPDGTVPEGIGAIDSAEAGVAKQLGIHYISPIQERWFTPGDVGGLIDPATLHPNTAGHAYYAGRLVADLERFVGPIPAPHTAHKTHRPKPRHPRSRPHAG